MKESPLLQGGHINEELTKNLKEEGGIKKRKRKKGTPFYVLEGLQKSSEINNPFHLEPTNTNAYPKNEQTFCLTHNKFSIVAGSIQLLYPIYTNTDLIKRSTLFQSPSSLKLVAAQHKQMIPS